MANVNIWGPQAWSLLHGLCGFCTPSLVSGNGRQSTLNVSDYVALAKIFDLLRILLPCSLCLDSYKYFYSSLENDLNHSILEEFQVGGAFSFCFKLHSLVNEKLFKQRRGDLYLGKTLESSGTLKLEEAFKKVQNSPTFLVVEKRFKASDMHPFCEEAVWTFLASFCVHIDKEKTDEEKRKRVLAIHDFCGALSPLLLLGDEYDDLVLRIQSLDSLFLALHPSTTSLGLDLLCYAKHEGAPENKKPKIELLKDIYSPSSETFLERQASKAGYIEALTVKACTTSCQ